MSAVALPRMGLGRWQITGDGANWEVRYALVAAYRHIDTARLYGNEEQIGRHPRRRYWPRRPLPHHQIRAARARRGTEALIEGLRRLGVDGVDLSLMPFPQGCGRQPAGLGGFLAAADQGRAAAVGASNHCVEQLDALTAASCRPPAVNQIRFNPALYDAELVAAHRHRGVIL
jgi:2,5-diketo-D-gluconate reductase A